MQRKAVFLSLGVGLALAAAQAERPSVLPHDRSAASFDCAKASTRTEKLICSDGSLSVEDGDRDYLYRSLLRHAAAAARPKIQADQRAWLSRRDRCADKKCLLTLDYARDDVLRTELDHWNRILRRPVSRIGQCQATTIEYIGPRLGNGISSKDKPDDNGTSVFLADGVKLVSYEFERAVARSRLGDNVRVCLVSIPHRCPPGDDRGREYAVTNLRTGGKWRMPDAEHMCGGA